MPWNETSGNNFAALAGSLGSNASSLTQGIQQGASGLAGAILDQGQRNFDNNLKLWEYEDKRDKARQDALADADSSAAFVEAASITPDEYNQMKDQGRSLYEELMARHPMALFGGNNTTSLSDLLTGSTTSKHNRLSGIQSIVEGLEKKAEERSQNNLYRVMSDGYEHSADEIRSIGGYANLTDNEVQDKLTEGNAHYLAEYISHNATNGFLRPSTTNAMITYQDMLKGISDRLEKSGMYVNDKAINQVLNDPNISKYLSNLGNQNLITNINKIQKDLFEYISNNPDIAPEEALKQIISAKVTDFQLLSSDQQKIVLGKMQELVDQKAKMANDPNSVYSRIFNNKSIAINTKYADQLDSVTTTYRNQLRKAAEESFIPYMGGSSLTSDQRTNLINLFEAVNSTGLSSVNVPEGDLDQIVQVGSELTDLHIDLKGRSASDVLNIYRNAIEYGYKDKLKMQQAINCLSNYKNFDSKELQYDRESALEYFADNRDKIAAASGVITSAETMGKTALQGVNEAYRAKVDAIKIGQQQELSKLSNIAFAGASTGHSASDILKNIDKSDSNGLISSDAEVMTNMSQADARLLSKNAAMANVKSGSYSDITPEDLKYESNYKLGPLSRLADDFNGYNGSDDTTGFHTTAEALGGGAAALAALVLSKGRSGKGLTSWLKYFGGKTTKGSLAGIGGAVAGSEIADRIPDSVPFSDGSRDEQYAINKIKTASQRGASKEELANLARKAYMMYPNNKKLAQMARDYSIAASK